MNAPTETTSTLRSVLIIGVLGLVACVALLGVTTLTETGIRHNAERYAMRHLDRLIAPDTYTNNPVQDVLTVTSADLLGGNTPRRVYRAFRNSEPVALAIETVAPAGYSGPIHLLVAIHADGRVAGVEVLAHRETLNLGDRIERRNSHWLEQFDARTLNDPTRERWAVKRDGGAFDQFTGATVTPRAVVEAVRDALIYFEQHATELFEPPNNS